jgi:hypothetical protein
MGAKAADAAVNVQPARNATLVTGVALVADFVVGDLTPGTAFKNAILCEAHNAVLGMEFGVHPLDHITYQRRLVVQLTKCAQYTVAVTVACEGEALTAPDTRWESGAVNLILDGAMPG